MSLAPWLSDGWKCIYFGCMATNISGAATVPIVSVEMSATVAEKSTGPIEPGLVFAVPTVTHVAKKKALAKKPVSAKAKREGKGGFGATRKEETYSHVKPKRVVIGAPALPILPESKTKEEGSTFGDDDYNPLSTGAPEVSLTKEEVLAMTLKESMATIWRSRPLEKIMILLRTYEVVSPRLLLLYLYTMHYQMLAFGQCLSFLQEARDCLSLVERRRLFQKRWGLPGFL